MLLAALYRCALLSPCTPGAAALHCQINEVTVEIRAVNACELGLAASGKTGSRRACRYRQP